MQQAEDALLDIESSLQSQIAHHPDRVLEIDMRQWIPLLALAIFSSHLLGRAQVWADAEADRSRPVPAPPLARMVLTGSFAPLPFEEAIAFFRSKVTLTPSEFALLTDAARVKAFSIAAGVTEHITGSVREMLDMALREGVTLREFQDRAAQVLDHAGVSARAPWYWETVYRTNLQTSYEVGRWKQQTHKDVVWARPYLRYMSARLPTSRKSHIEKHGWVLSTDDPFWDEFYPPNGFNCYCTTHTVSERELEREGWKIATATTWKPADEGFRTNPGKAEEI